MPSSCCSSRYSISSGRAVRIDRTYGQESIAKIKENPCQLADDIRGISTVFSRFLVPQLGDGTYAAFRGDGIFFPFN